jgi:hypothetical protein
MPKFQSRIHGLSYRGGSQLFYKCSVCYHENGSLKRHPLLGAFSFAVFRVSSVIVFRPVYFTRLRMIQMITEKYPS